MSILRLLAPLVALLAPAVALACSCMWAGPFTKVGLATDLVVLADVRAYYRHGMDLAVVEVLKGAETRREIRVWGDTGALCRPYVTAFPLGTRWILALKRETGTRDYVISVCGDFWLAVHGDRVVGRIATAEHGALKESARLSDVREWVRSGGATPVATQPQR